jgi:hypothetical protein
MNGRKATTFISTFLKNTSAFISNIEHEIFMSVVDNF